MGLSMAFLTIIYAQIALKSPSFLKLRHFTFLRTLKSTQSNNTDSFASLVSEAAKAQTGAFTAEGYILMDGILQTGFSIPLSLLMLSR